VSGLPVQGHVAVVEGRAIAPMFGLSIRGSTVQGFMVHGPGVQRSMFRGSPVQRHVAEETRV